MPELKNNNLLKLLELTINEEQFFLVEHQKRITFFTGVISTLLGITIYGFNDLISKYLLSQNNEVINIYPFVFLIIIPFLIICVSIIAKASTFRFYQRFIETITIRAKIEHDMGLTANRLMQDSLKSNWEMDPYLPPRYLMARKGTPVEFIYTRLNKGYQKWARRLFDIFSVISIIIITGLLVTIFHFLLKSVEIYNDNSLFVSFIVGIIILSILMIFYLNIKKQINRKQLEFYKKAYDKEINLE